MIGVLESIVSRITLLDAAMFWIWVLSWLMFALVAGGIAQGKGHDGGGYFLLGLLLSPLVGLTAAVFANNRHAEIVADLRKRLAALEKGASPPPADASADPAAGPAPAAVSGGAAEPSMFALLVQFVGWLIAVGLVGGGVWLLINRPR